LQVKHLWRNWKSVFPVHRLFRHSFHDGGSLGEGGRGSVLCLRLHRVALQHAKTAALREDFTADGTDDTDGANAECKMQNEEFLSVKSVKSALNSFGCGFVPRWASLHLFAAIPPSQFLQN
jgi:hypothetical protein